jgi:hypothetical protein
MRLGRDPVAFLKPEDNGGLEETNEEQESETDEVVEEEDVYIPMRKSRKSKLQA